MRQLKITKSITNRESQSLDKYLQDIGKEELITAEIEVELAKRIKQGDQKALEKLTRANLRFVVSVAKQYQNQGLTLADLINEGNLGLIKAAQKFDETRGFKFISYAVWWIRQSVLRALIEQARIIRLPLNRVRSCNKIVRTISEFEKTYGYEPNTEQLEQLLKIDKRKINDILQDAQKHISMDAPFSDNDDEYDRHDTMEGEDLSGTDNKMEKEAIRQAIKEAMSVLPKRDADIVSCYFGLRGETHTTLEEI